jgi:hypothetical protein
MLFWTMLPSLMHPALAWPLFLTRLYTSPPLPIDQQQRIFDNSLFVTCAIPILRSSWSAWNRVLMVIVRW